MPVAQSGQFRMNYSKAKRYIVNRLKQELPPELYYHCFEHTVDVHQSAKELAGLEGVDGDDLVLIKTAALFHDSGFLLSYVNHEQFGAGIAEEVLPEFGYNPEQVKQVCGMIKATRIPQTPGNHLEEILCDADLDYLGRDDYYQVSDMLKRELEAQNRISTEQEWVDLQVGFLEQHSYFTQSAIERRAEAKAARLKELKNNK